MKIRFYYRGPFNLLTVYGWKSLFQFGTVSGLHRCGPIGWIVTKAPTPGADQ